MSCIVAGTLGHFRWNFSRPSGVVNVDEKVEAQPLILISEPCLSFSNPILQVVDPFPRLAQGTIRAPHWGKKSAER
jgi:hypothetical protein